MIYKEFVVFFLFIFLSKDTSAYQLCINDEDKKRWIILLYMACLQSQFHMVFTGK